MSAAHGQRWAMGRRARQRGRILESFGGTIPWAGLEQLRAQGGWRPVSPPHANSLLKEAGPTKPPLVRQSTEAAAWEQRLRALPRRVRGALQRHFALPLTEVALLLALWQGPGWAATINVDGTICTLAEAITAANTDTAGGGCPAGHGADTLVLPAGSTVTLKSVDNVSGFGYTGLPVVSSAITIAGQGSTLIRDVGPPPAPTFRLLKVTAPGNLTVQDLTLRNGAAGVRGGGAVVNYGGTVTLANCTIAGNTAGRGGGVASYGGTVTLTNSTLSSNSAPAFDGGGVFNATGSTLTLVHSTIMDNSAVGRGAGVANSGTLTLIGSRITGNGDVLHAFKSGGGLANLNGIATMVNSTISGNTAFGDGGGVANLYTGLVTLVNNTLSGNTATNTGGGVWNLSGSLTLANSTISGNLAGSDSGHGGGVYNRGSLTLANSTLSRNRAVNFGGGVYNRGTLTLAQTLVSGNTATAAAEISHDNSIGTVMANSVNLFGQNGTHGVVGFTPGATDIVPGTGVVLSDILDPTLAFNGGPTRTHVPVGGSPALDAVLVGNCSDTDQRGFVRPSGAACDGGAVELGASPPPVVNNLVDFVPLALSFSTTTDVTGCPGGLWGSSSSRHS